MHIRFGARSEPLPAGRSLESPVYYDAPKSIFDGDDGDVVMVVIQGWGGGVGISSSHKAVLKNFAGIDSVSPLFPRVRIMETERLPPDGQFVGRYDALGRGLVRRGVRMEYVAMAPSTGLRLDPDVSWHYGLANRPPFPSGRSCGTSARAESGGPAATGTYSRNHLTFVGKRICKVQTGISVSKILKNINLVIRILGAPIIDRPESRNCVPDGWWHRGTTGRPAVSLGPGWSA